MTEHIQHIQQLVDELQKQGSANRESVQIRADAGLPLPIFVGRRFPGGNFIAKVVGLSADLLPPNYRKPELKGLSLYWEDQAAKAGSRFDLILELAEKTNLDIFIVFIGRLCDDIGKADGQKNAVHRVLSQVDRWKNFFSGSIDRVLPETKQTGLYGELHQLGQFCASDLEVARVFDAWTGSRATNQDFEFGTVAVEIKSTVAIDATNFAVSNIRQLDPVGLEKLYLFRLAFDVRQGSENTLPNLVEFLRNVVKNEAGASALLFEENLLRSGYRDRHAESYSQRSYTQRFCDPYIVTDGFPRLEEADLPSGVLGVRYDVSLIGCEPYTVEYNEVVTEIGSRR